MFNGYTTSLNNLRNHQVNIALGISLDVYSMNIAYHTRRRLMSNMIPGTSTFKLVFGKDLVQANTLPMKVYLDEVLTSEFNNMNKTINGNVKSFSSFFKILNYDKRPFNYTLHRNLLTSHDIFLKRDRRP